MIAGIIGIKTQKAPVLYGDALNVAKRLTSLNSFCQSFILMTRSTFEAVQVLQLSWLLPPPCHG